MFYTCRYILLYIVTGIDPSLYLMNEIICCFREKNLLLGGDNFGRDLLSVQKLQKSHQQFQAQLTTHKSRKESLLSLGKKLTRDSPHVSSEAIRERCAQFEGVWESLVEASNNRKRKLEEALLYQQFCVSLDEEEAWLNEKTVLVSNEDSGDTLAAVQVHVLTISTSPLPLRLFASLSD